MTTAREIIARHLCTMAAQGWSAISPFERAAYRTAAHGMIATLAAAGFRILGPDEVDAVTVEKCAKVADKITPKSMEWNPYAAWVQRAAAAIRALGRKA